MRDIATTYGKNNILVTRFVAVIDIVASANHYAMPPPHPETGIIQLFLLKK